MDKYYTNLLWDSKEQRHEIKIRAVDAYKTMNQYILDCMFGDSLADLQKQAESTRAKGIKCDILDKNGEGIDKCFGDIERLPDDKDGNYRFKAKGEFKVGKGTYTDPQTDEKDLKKSTKEKLKYTKEKKFKPLFKRKGMEFSVSTPKANEVIAEHTCEKCKNVREDVYTLWEEGEEKVVCLNCIKKSVPEKMLKSYLRKLNKL